MWTPHLAPDDEIRKKKTIVLVTGAMFLVLLVAMASAHDQIRAVAMGERLASVTLLARATTSVPAVTPTATPSPALTVTATPGSALTALAALTATTLPTPTATVALPAATQTPVSPTATPTSKPPTATATPIPLPTATWTPTATATPIPLPTATWTPAALPVPVLTSPTDGAEVLGAGLVLEGTAPPGTVVVVYDGEDELGTAQADAQGHWKLEVSQPLAEGKHDLTARVKDGERVGEPSQAVQVMVVGARLPVTGGE